MPDFSALQAIWATLPVEDTTEQKLAAVNTMTVARPPVDVTVKAVNGYLSVNGKAGAVFNYATNPPGGAIPQAVAIAQNLATVLFHMAQPPDFGTHDPATLANLAAMLGALVADPLCGLTTADASALLALAQPTMPWSRANGYGTPITLADVAGAGLV